MYVHIYIYINMYVCIYIYVCMYVCMYVCTCIYIYTNCFVRQWLEIVTQMLELRPILSGSTPPTIIQHKFGKNVTDVFSELALAQNLWGTCLGVVCRIFRLFRQETCTHMFTFACTFQFVVVKFTPKKQRTVLFSFGEAPKKTTTN